ncbi:hypothetical protein GOP47_0001695 [Adiantum capillus-veneris]|uniref:Trichome birefringence-like C-terminal domain-containing protein n=1 Tax=Adiantum capillus-veneris TaxID=13818 RepID=A0A9D4ZQD0_ADICA|nr:hypothetical protein GOP47_0001695 [Adiantum capillus-veneris]
MGAKHPPHHHNAAKMKKLLIWSLAVVLPFLVFVCIFPSRVSDIYKPSYNRIVISQFQIPGIQSGSLESKLSSDDAPLHEGNLEREASEDKDGTNGGGDATKSSVGKADSLPKAAKIDPKETVASTITEGDGLFLTSKAEKQNHETMTNSLSADEGSLSSSKLKKQSDGGGKKNHNDGHEGKFFPKNAKQQNDEDLHGDIYTASKGKNQNDAEKTEVPSSAKKAKKGAFMTQEKEQNEAEETEAPTIYVKSSKKSKKQAQRGGEDKSEINAFMAQREVDELINGEPNIDSKKKKKNSDLNTESEAKKKLTKKGKTTQYNAEKMPEIELEEEELTISAKHEKGKTNLAGVAESKKKTTKKAKAMQDTDKSDLNVEDSIVREKKAGQDEEDSSTAKSSKKAKFAHANELEEEGVSILGKESNLEEEEDPMSFNFKSTSSNQSSRKAMGMNSGYNGKDDDAAEEEVSLLGKKSRHKKREKFATEEQDEEEGIKKKPSSFTKSGKPSDGDDDDGGGSSAGLLFWEGADDKDFLSEATEAKEQKKKVPRGSADADDNSPDLDEVDDREGEERIKVSKKKAKDADGEEEYSVIKKKHGDYGETFGNIPSKSRTKRSSPSSNDDDGDELPLEFARKDRNKDSDSAIGKNEEGSSDDSLDSPTSTIGQPLPLKQSMSSGTCRYFKGKWTNDPAPYVDSTCSWKSVNDEQSCKSTKKSRNWRWKPSECNMKRFSAATFLKLMQGKSMAFVGDKMVRAQLKSLVCLLDQVEAPRLVYDDKSNQSVSWRFDSSNVTISLLWSPHLVQHTSEGQYSTLYLDKLDTKWASMVPTLDVLVLGVGAHFTQPSLYTTRNSVVGCYSCQNLSPYIDITNLKEISLYSGFRGAMRSSILGIGALPGFGGVALFLQPFGFEGNGSYNGVSLKMKDIQDQELKKAQSRGSISNQSKMEVLHTNLNSVSNFDPIKSLSSPSCLIPSPLANTWNQVLQHTLTRMFTLELDT